MEERTGEAFELNERLTVIGRKLRRGDRVRPRLLRSQDVDHADGATRGFCRHVRLLNIINSLDTPVCHTETRRWEDLRVGLPPVVRVYTISMDLPFAQARWLTAERVGHQALSAHRDDTFGRDYGVLIKEWRLLQRAVVVIDRQGRIVHTEYVADQMREPNYDDAVRAARKAAV